MARRDGLGVSLSATDTVTAHKRRRCGRCRKQRVRHCFRLAAESAAFLSARLFHSRCLDPKTKQQVLQRSCKKQPLKAFTQVSVCFNNMLSTGSHRRHLRHLRRLGLEAPCRQLSIDLYWCGFVDLYHLTQTSRSWDRRLLTTVCMSVNVADWMLPLAHRWALGMVIKVSPELQMSIFNRCRRAIVCILRNVADAY